MKNSFREYHQFTEEELKQLWESCLFVFDTNTLLNMYRYSRKTVESYFNVLNELKGKKQLWIPYQVGYEFYENRIDVIAEYESSYDVIMAILEKAKNDIEVKYKDHPFLDLDNIKSKIGEPVIEQIKDAKEKHPKWTSKDDVLDRINQIFEGSIGINYDKIKLEAIKKEGEERYSKEIPPGYKDSKKPGDKKYGDLILWNQIIDKAKESKKSIIFISGDVKEDWWLEKNGKRLMPLPQLKKEIFDKARVDFHMYTADRFLEYYKKEGTSDAIDPAIISEVRKIRELEEEKMLTRRLEIVEKEINPRIFERHSIERYMEELEVINELVMEINEENPHLRHVKELKILSLELKNIRDRLVHGESGDRVFFEFFKCIENIRFIVRKLSHLEGGGDAFSARVDHLLQILSHLRHRMMRFCS